MREKVIRPNLKYIGLTNAFLFMLTFTFGQSKTLGSDIVDPKSKIKEVFSGGEGLLLEGPTMAPDGTLYFTDITITQFEGMKAGIIWNYNPQTGETKVFRSPSGMANGLSFDSDGNLIACEGADFGGRRIVKTDMKTGKSTIVSGLFNDRPFNAPNDLVIDNNGRIYFTDPRYFGKEPINQPVDGVYRIDTDGTVHLIIANASKPNGIAISPDYKTLYVANFDFNGTSNFLPGDFKGPASETSGAILEYTLLPDGNVQFNGTLINLMNDGPDGIKVDSEGNIYIAVRGNIGVYSPKGEKLTEIEVPNKSATNLCFGRGKWSRTLFITTGKKLYTIETKKEGFHIPFKR
ncbi:SMP-30/gluconolactonase/LRE family protein [Aegicerativicinus sediminis]|uniref:SMP-30/gluconolactonase/LRE family protein n=1 Tax=Aegicerativicinus sediminis TaxID=2893202 RepID=UPI001E3BB526|nr:SMP-30/gluconolactonase/LRE family protein [Aegicerativicinus sediminis]